MGQVIVSDERLFSFKFWDVFFVVSSNSDFIWYFCCNFSCCGSVISVISVVSVMYSNTSPTWQLSNSQRTLRYSHETISPFRSWVITDSPIIFSLRIRYVVYPVAFKCASTLNLYLSAIYITYSHRIEIIKNADSISAFISLKSFSITIVQTYAIHFQSEIFFVSLLYNFCIPGLNRFWCVGSLCC